MSEKPILFKAEMVCAILDGRKTQTRRLKGLELVNEQPGDWSIGGLVSDEAGLSGVQFRRGEIRTWVEPPMRVGDRIWVKETWRTVWALDDCKPSEIQRGATIEWAARGNNLNAPRLYDMAKNWRSPLFMMRWMSRLTLELTAVRCERLQDISDADVEAEGTPLLEEHKPDVSHASVSKWWRYQHLWESINGKGSWSANPFVWVYTFKKL